MSFLSASVKWFGPPAHAIWTLHLCAGYTKSSRKCVDVQSAVCPNWHAFCCKNRLLHWSVKCSEGSAKSMYVRCIGGVYSSEHLSGEAGSTGSKKSSAYKHFVSVRVVLLEFYTKIQLRCYLVSSTIKTTYRRRRLVSWPTRVHLHHLHIQTCFSPLPLLSHSPPKSGSLSQPV